MRNPSAAGDLEKALADAGQSAGTNVEVIALDVLDETPPARVVVPSTSETFVQARGATPPEQIRQVLALTYRV